MAGGNYIWRPLGKNRKTAYDFIQANPGCTKKQIIAGTGLRSESVKNALEKGKKAGEIIAHETKCLRDYTYSIGVLIDRTPRGRNWERRESAKANPMPQRGRKGMRSVSPVPKPKAVKPKVVKPKVVKLKPPVIKQTKEWIPPEPKKVTVTYPENFKVTVYKPSYQYEPLDVRRHIP